MDNVSIPFHNLCKKIKRKISESISFSTYFYNRNPQTERTQFETELESTITWVYEWVLENSYGASLSSNASIINYWKTLKQDIIMAMAKHIRKKINEIFGLDFKDMKQNLVKIMNDEIKTTSEIPLEQNIVKIMNHEIIATFEIPLDLLLNCIKPIFKEAEEHLTQSDYPNSSRENNKYINHFNKTVVAAMRLVMAGERLAIIDRTTNELQIRLRKQLKLLKIKVSKVLGEIF